MQSRNLTSVVPGVRLGFKDGADGDVILEEDAVEHVRHAVSVLRCQLTELEEMLLDQFEPETQEDFK